MLTKVLLSLLVLFGFGSVLNASVNDKTVVKNSTLKTDVKSGNVDVKGKLNMGHVKVAKGTQIEGSSVESKVQTGNVKVGKGGKANIGGVDIGH